MYCCQVRCALALHTRSESSDQMFYTDYRTVLATRYSVQYARRVDEISTHAPVVYSAVKLHCKNCKDMQLLNSRSATQQFGGSELSSWCGLAVAP